MVTVEKEPRRCDICSQGCILVMIQPEDLAMHRAEHLRDAWLATVQADGLSETDEEKAATEVAESIAHATLIAYLDAEHLHVQWDPRPSKRKKVE